MDPSMNNKSIVSILDLDIVPTHCGYCDGSGSLSQGLIFDQLTVGDYQNMIDRGWRRSGRYVYKPIMDKTCCPLYTIRCHSSKFQPSQSQRKVIKKIQNFIQNGCKEAEKQQATIELPEKKPETSNNKKDEAIHKNSENFIGKAKHMRRKKHIQKLIASGKMDQTPLTLSNNTPKTLSDLVPKQGSFSLNEKLLQSGTDSKHKFELRLVKADLSDASFMNSLHESYQVYKKYQMQIHKDTEFDCDIQTYAGFLCDSPLMYEASENLMFGSFHQQYIIDDKIVCVGVLDILPGCVSSVYLYYDPDWWGQKPTLSPGTYSALREVQLTKELKLPYYYMGYYIHSVPKMRYKGRFLPSDLLSPSSLSWHDITLCTPQLENSKLCTFESIDCVQAPPEKMEVNENKIKILVSDKLISYSEFKMQQEEDEELIDYIQLIGYPLAEALIIKRD